MKKGEVIQKMLGYHDSPQCPFDIWAPKPDTWGDNAIENRAFSPFCKQMTENEEIIEQIASGNYDMDLDNRSKEDLEYIQYELRKRYGIVINYKVT